MDYSTINLPLLRTLPDWTSPGGRWSVSDHPGSGCFGDPPGYPSYFLRHIYQNGNSPHRNGAAEVVIREGGADRIVCRVGDGKDSLPRLLRQLWVPLPYGHERVRLWIRATYRHLNHCYRDDGGLVVGPKDNGLLIYPVSGYALRAFRDDPRFSEAWRASERAAVAAFNADVEARAAKVAIPENHCAVRRIREFYPEHAPDLDLIERAPTDLEGDWWESEATRPSIEQCAPRNGIGARDHDTQWCQWCGRHPGQAD